MLTKCPIDNSELRVYSGHYSCDKHGSLVYKKCGWSDCKLNVWAFKTWENSVNEESPLYCTEHAKLVNKKMAERRAEQIRRALEAEISEIHNLNDLNSHILELEKERSPVAPLLKKLRAKREEEFFGV